MLKATLIGNLTADSDLRYSASGKPMLQFNVASNHRTRTPEGEYVDRAEFVRVTIVGQRAEGLGQYLKKGTKVCVFGKLEARPWTTREREIRAGLEILAVDVEFFNSPGQSGDVGDGVSFRSRDA